jgi:tetratricopeptide (TPR) repeat protein
LSSDSDGLPFALRIKGARASVAGETPAVEAELRAEGRHEELVELLLGKLDTLTDPRARAEALIQIGQSLRKLNDDEQAFDALLEAWSTDPTCVEVLDPLEELTRALAKWPVVIQATETLVAKERDVPRALALAEAMVGWLTREVPTRELAMHYLDRIKKIDPTHWTLHLYQAAVYQEHGDVRRELEELDKAVLSARRVEDRVRIHLMMAARLSEDRAFNKNEGRKHFDAVLKLRPGHSAALEGLEALFAKTGDFTALAETLDKQAEAVPDDDLRGELLKRVAQIYETRFLKPEVAAEKLERVFAMAPLDQGALAALERCYTAAHAWQKLVTVLERAVVATEDDALRVEQLKRIAKVHELQLQDAEGARRAWERVDALVPDHEEALAELARLSDRVGDVPASVKYRSNLVTKTEDPLARARSHLTLGQMLSPADKNPAAARKHLEEAVALDPSLTQAWNILFWMAREAGDHARMAAYLEDRANATAPPRQRAQLFIELAETRAKHLRDDAGALAAYEAAHEADPQNEPAAQALLDYYVLSERWDEAAPLHEIATIAAERDKDLERRFALLRTGRRISTALGYPELALASALVAFELRSADLDAQRELIDAASAVKDDKEQLARAKDALERIAKDIETPKPGPPRAGKEKEAPFSPDRLAALGDLLVGSGSTKPAYAMYDLALAADPNHRGALAGLAALCELESDVVVATALKRRLAQTLEADDEKFATLMASGDKLAQAGKLPLAAEAYEEARAVRPKDRPLLHTLMQHYTTLERWADLLRTLRAIAESDDDKLRRGKTVSAMALIAEDKLGDLKQALALNEEALDLDATRLEAFERVVRRHTQTKDWFALEQAYRRMITRALGGGDKKLQKALYTQAGLVVRDRVGDTERAIQYFRAASELDKDDTHVQTILRELLGMAGQVGGAIEVALERVNKDPLAPDGWGPLCDLYMQAQKYDRAWLAASALEHLGALDPAHAQIYHARRPVPLDAIPGKLDVEGLGVLLHPDLDPLLTKIFQIVAPAVIDLKLARMSLRQRMAYPGSRAANNAPLVRAVTLAAECLFLGPPKVFLGKSGAALTVATTRPPSLIASPDALEGTLSNVLPFLAGRHVFALTPPLLARAVCPTVSELTALATAAAHAALGDPSSELKPFLKAHDLSELAALVERARAAQGEIDVKRWSQLADLSASRAGLLLAGDLKLAHTALARESQSAGDLPLKDQLRELSLFAISDAHANLRQTLGIAVPVPMK